MIMIQCKTRFWEAKYNIRGGFSKTTLPIGQLRYPTTLDDEDIHKNKGILLVYCWRPEAFKFGLHEDNNAIRRAVNQIAHIHPEITEQFEHAAIHTWYYAQGAQPHLKPKEFNGVRWLFYPWKNVYFAGETTSFTYGWIQGALESGLRAAYQFYARNEQNSA